MLQGESPKLLAKNDLQCILLAPLLQIILHDSYLPKSLKWSSRGSNVVSLGSEVERRRRAGSPNCKTQTGSKKRNYTWINVALVVNILASYSVLLANRAHA